MGDDSGSDVESPKDQEIAPVHPLIKIALLAPLDWFAPTTPPASMQPRQVQSLGNLIASVTAGTLYTAVSPAAGLGFAAALMLIALGAITRSTQAGAP